MPKKSVLEELNLNATNGIYCIYPFSQLDTDGKGCFKIGLSASSFKARFNQYFTCFPMGIYYVNFLVNPTKCRTQNKRRKEDEEYYKLIEMHLKKLLGKSSAKRVISRTGVTGSSEWWYTDMQTIEDVFKKLEKKFGGESVPYDLLYAFKHEEPSKTDVYFTGKTTYY
jgi:hypothetical protein